MAVKVTVKIEAERRTLYNQTCRNVHGEGKDDI